MKVSFKFVLRLFYVSIGSFSFALMEQFLSLWNCSLLKETVYRHGTVAVHLCVLLPFIKEPAFMTSCSLPWVAKSSEIDLFMRKTLFRREQIFIAGKQIFSFGIDSICEGGRN